MLSGGKLAATEGGFVSSSDLSESAIRFGEFVADLETGELQRNGTKIKLQGQPFEILVMLLNRPGRTVTREELRLRLWPSDTFVDFEHGLNAAVNRLRETLGDSAEEPRFIETVPRRGYRFIATLERSPSAGPAELTQMTPDKSAARLLTARSVVVFAAILLCIGASLFIYDYVKPSTPPVQRALMRLTFDDGLQIGATWSPDARFIAYSANRAGKFDIWVQQIEGGNPVQVTSGPGQNWQPDWSPDGKYIAYRSEQGEGGLYVIPALGGAGQERRISSFGYYPRWSPDSTQILFQSMDLGGMNVNRFYVVNLDGTPPREVLKELITRNQSFGISAAWHPDGKRISAWIQDTNVPLTSIPTFWTVPVDGGTPVKSEIPAEIQKPSSSGPGWCEWRQDFKFSWAPSGRAIYFERTFQGARNLWRMSIEPETLRATGVERLTTGPDTDTQLSLSADGKKLAFTGASEQIRAWLFPFDADHAQVTGPGEAITSPGVEALALNLSRDGTKLGFSTVRTNHWQHWVKTLSDGLEIPVSTDGSYAHTIPAWSPDGTQLVYSRQKLSTGEVDVVEWSVANRTEQSLTGVSKTWGRVWDWSPDGKTLLFSQANSDTDLEEVWQLSVSSGPNEATQRRIAFSGTDDLFQPKFSPDARWIAFEAVRSNSKGLDSALYVVPAKGGTWIRLTEGKNWDDKPRWAPDGRTVYFISRRDGFYDLWGIRFDPLKGRPVGEPFLVKAFETASSMIPKNMVIVEISLTQKHLAVPLQQISGGIWMLDNVDR
jgi:Tol biopolymer transport system component/DNA-binding winged helix-turn-helix (wHTH) protein